MIKCRDSPFQSSSYISRWGKGMGGEDWMFQRHSMEGKITVSKRKAASFNTSAGIHYYWADKFLAFLQCCSQHVVSYCCIHSRIISPLKKKKKSKSKSEVQS